MKNRHKTRAALFLALAGGFLTGFPGSFPGGFLGGPAAAAAAAFPQGRPAVCRQILLHRDLEEGLSRLSESAESMFQEARLHGVYFIGENDLKGGEGAYAPVFTPATAEGEIFLIPAYYEALFELLAPVFYLNRAGAIAADTWAHAHKIQKALREKFPEREFLLYKNILPAGEKAKMLKKAAEGEAYIIVLKDQAPALDLSRVPVYISLARAAEINRIQEARGFVDSYKGRRPANVFLLSAAKSAAPNKETIHRLRQTSVNADLKARKIWREKKLPDMTAEEALAHIQAWGFESREELKKWHQSFLRPKRFPPLSFEDLKGLLDLHSLWQSRSGAAGPQPPQSGERLALRPRLPSRRVKIKYGNFSEAEKARIEALIEGPSGLELSSKDREILRRRLFSPDRMGLREIASNLGISMARISQKEKELLALFQKSPSIPLDLRRRIKDLTNLRADRGSWFGYSGFSEEEKAQIDKWAAAAKSRLKLTEGQKALMDHYIFTDRPKSLNELKAQFHFADYRAVDRAHSRFLRELAENPAAPSGLREAIKRRMPKEEPGRDVFFRFESCSPEEKSLIALLLPEFKKELDFTEREIYIMDHYIFAESRMSLRKIGKVFGADATAVLFSARRILRNLMENRAIPFEFRDLLRRRSAPPRKRKLFRYSDLPEEKKPEADKMAAAAKAILGLDEASAYIFDNIFKDAPEPAASIERRLGLKPRFVELRKNSLLNQLKTNKDVPAGLRALIQNGAGFQAFPEEAQNP